MQQLKGKVAVVTGAASGIGLAMAKRFAAEGMKVVMVDIEPKALDAALVQLPTNTDALTVITDVAKADQMDALGARVLERFGAVHLVCNNAGVGSGSRVWKASVQEWEWVIGVNLWGVIHGIRVFAPHMLKQNEGHIVNTASVAGLLSPPGMAPYNVTKHAVVTLSETLFHELKQEKTEVGVSVLCPGFVQTRIHEADRNLPSALREVAAATPRTDDERVAMEKRRAQMAQVVAAGLPAERVAEAVLEAVKTKKFYILTHPELIPFFEDRARRLAAGQDPHMPGVE
jgi:NAD(P)-dependent dehydrogenase (short-subunit alcohol dehydrogenase family)